jgi:hypothetical protein
MPEGNEMPRFTFDEVKKDSLTLEEIDSNADYMTIEEECWDLMADPTKKRAKQMYASAIRAWFGCIGQSMACGGGLLVSEYVLLDQRVIDIGEKYGYL